MNKNQSHVIRFVFRYCWIQFADILRRAERLSGKKINPPANTGQALQETQVQFVGREDPLELEMSTPSSILAWRILWTEEPGGYSPWGRRESDATDGPSARAAHDFYYTHGEYWPGVSFLVVSLAGSRQPHKVGWRYSLLLRFL